MFTTRRMIATATAALALAGTAVLGVAAPASAAPTGTDRVGICKATGSQSNPFVFISTTADKLAAGNYSSNDLVSPYDYIAADGTIVHFLGQGTSGVLDASCTPVIAQAAYIL